MAAKVIEQYLPKTTDYINWVFDTEGKERGGHHNYVAEQYVLNTITPLASQNAVELSDTDEALLNKLRNLDNCSGCDI
ncbi:hypothetical protein [Salinivibrio costicola]|uniref:hypothetical protein n=1 Tax=Salinivibrio costicola TaxID=51367 RepID=UPI003F7260AF